MPEPKTFGQQLRKLRNRAGLSQEALAKKLGQSRPSTVQAWEKDRRKPRPSSVRRIAAALGSSAAELVSGVASDFDQLRGPAELVEALADQAVRQIVDLVSRLDRAQQDEVLKVVESEVRARGIALPDESAIGRPRGTKLAKRTKSQ